MISFLLILGHFNSTVAQSRSIEADTIIESEWIDGEWKPILTLITVLNTKDSLIQLTYTTSASGELVQTGRQTKLYNESSNIETFIVEFYFPDIDTYLNSTLVNYRYDLSGNQIDFQYLKWRPATHQWTNYIRQEHLDYDEYNNCGLWINYNGDGQQWVKSSETLFERYYENTSLDSLMSRRKYVNDSVVPFYGATQYQRDENGNELLRTIYKPDLRYLGGIPSYSVQSAYFEETSFLSNSTVRDYDDALNIINVTETQFQWRDDGSPLHTLRYQIVGSKKLPKYLIEYKNKNTNLSKNLESSIGVSKG